MCFIAAGGVTSVPRDWETFLSPTRGCLGVNKVQEGSRLCTSVKQRVERRGTGGAAGPASNRCHRREGDPGLPFVLAVPNNEGYYVKNDREGGRVGTLLVIPAT